MRAFRSTVLMLLLCAPFAAAQEEGEETSGRKCTCRDGNGSYLWLRCPKAPPADPDPCPAAHDGMHPGVPVPKEWNDMCWMSNRMSCFLRRHAASWRITCSLCHEKKCCPYPNWHNCPECHGEEKEAQDPELPLLLQTLEEQKKIGGKRIEMAVSPHYVIVMDHPSLKIATSRGGPRVATQHELLHLYLQRLEMARRDFEQYFGPARSMRSLVILVKSESTRRAFSAVHWGNDKTNLLYGGGAGKHPMNAGNGFILSGRDDDDLHFNCRHMVGHLCISTYHSSGIHEKHLPQWIFRGAAHWLCKLHPRAENHVYFCSYEGVTVSGSGSRWDDKARKIASRGPQRDPVEAMFQAATAKAMDYDMHVRSWSWFDTFLREDREPFVKFVQMLREAKEARVAAKEAWGQAPEYVDDRWRERVLGKRRDVEAKDSELEKEVDVDEATARELRGIANEGDLQLMAGKIRGLERCQNVKTARLLLSLLDSRNSDRVREVIPIVLSRTTDEEVLAYLRGEGFDRAGKVGRATLCRVFGETKHEAAIPVLRKAMDDSFWLTEANAMRALALMGDAESIPVLAQRAGSDGKPKVRIAAMEALGILGGAAKGTIPQWERNLMHTAWQVKVATCAAFRAVGDTAAIDMLISRIDSEGGRVDDEIRRSLKALTGREEQEWGQQEWNKWWTHMKKFSDLEEKMKEELEREAKRVEDKHKEEGSRTVAGPKKTGPPTYSVTRMDARAVGDVLDTSLSMEQGFTVSEAWQARLGRTYTANTRMGVCQEELEQAIRELDPRTRINVVFFNDRVRVWKDSPVSVASMGENAISAIKNTRPDGQTNYYDALRAILGLEDSDSGWSTSFPDTPDTLFFLTDGTPTDGEITKADELLAWFTERNRFARLRVHVIGMGNTGIDLEFLSKLARENDGTFLHMTGSH